MLKETIETAGCHPAKVYCSRSKPSDWYSFSDEPVEYIQRAIRHIEIGVRKAGYKAGIHHSCFRAYMYQFTIHPGAFSFFGNEKFTHQRIIYRAENHFTFLFQSYRNAANRNSMRIVYCSIDGIDYPLVF